MNAPQPPPRSYTHPKRASATPYSEKLIIQDAPTLEAGVLKYDDEPSFRRRIPLPTGPWVLILGFAAIILIGALLLKLPWSVAPGKSIGWSEAFFTATSATTVTGLVITNPAETFSTFGHVIILILIQVGGVGFISFSVLLLRLIGRRVTLQTRFMVQQSLATEQMSDVLRLTLYLLGVTLTIEGIGATLLWLRWRETMPDGEALWLAVFHAISSYCNAGFDLFAGSGRGVLFGYGTDWYTLTVMGSLIALGSFGVTVMYDLWSTRRTRAWALNTRFTLLVSLILTFLGTAVIWGDGSLHIDIYPPETTPLERYGAGLFTMVSSRTAGLTILPLNQLHEATQMIILLWMFIGGAPASMAGGAGSSTVSVLLFAVLATARGRSAAVAFGRTLPNETIAKAVAIMSVSAILVTVMTFLVAIQMEASIFPVAFEVVSAFANAGYSLGLTPELSNFGRALIALTMFWGRLGALTIVVALAQREQPTLIRYPEEPVILG